LAKLTRRYLDYNASTPLHPCLDRKWPQFAKAFANPSSLHESGRVAREAIESARETIASFISASPEQLVFTSSASEANNQVIQWVFDHHGPDAHVIISGLEHSSIREPVSYIQSQGVQVSIIEPDTQGRICVDDIAAAITDQTRLISVIWANNEIGTIQPIPEILALAQKNNIPFHTDAVQWLGKYEINLQTLDVDFMTLSGHKCYAPKGVGALYAKDPIGLTPFIRGGNHERGLRSGTENTMAIMAFAEVLAHTDPSALEAHIRPLKSQLVDQLSERISDYYLVGNQSHCLYNTLAFGIQGVDAQALAMNMDLLGIDIATGSACSSGATEPAHSIKAIRLPKSQQNEVVRLSLGQFTTAEDIEMSLAALSQSADQIRHA